MIPGSKYEDVVGQGPHGVRIFCRIVGARRAEQSAGIIVGGLLDLSIDI